MITTRATKRQIRRWKKYFEHYSRTLCPNRRTGAEIDEYFTAKYAHVTAHSESFLKAVTDNILFNEHSLKKLAGKDAPQIKCYKTGEVLVGIDTVSGEFHIESKNIKNAIPIYNDLFTYRGLDKSDLENYCMVGQYAELTGLILPQDM